MIARAAALVLLAAAGSAGAEVPPPDYFAGLYARIGRSAGPEPALIDDLVRIDPAEGGGLVLRVCAPEGAPGSAALDLQFDRFGDVENLLSGGAGQTALHCQFFNDLDNYPILFCGSAGAEGETPARFTLWARPGTDPSACGG